MSELMRAIHAETAAFEPDRIPQFETVLAAKRARDRRTRLAAAGAVLAAVAVVGAVLVPSLLGGSQDALSPASVAPSTTVSPSAAVAGPTSGLAPPGTVDALVLCRREFSGPLLTGHADCAVTASTDRLTSVREVLAAAKAVPAPLGMCLVGAGAWDLVWMNENDVVDRIRVPHATCKYAARGAEASFAVSDQLLETLRSVHIAGAGPGGAFDGLAEPAAGEASCLRSYPRDLAEHPFAFEAVVLGVSDAARTDAPNGPMPFSDVDVLVLERHAGQPAERLTVRAPIARPDADMAVGERLLVATDQPAALGGCGFTQPYSNETAQQWADAFR